ncbi:MAG: transglutaminase domain-containing protein [Methanoregula sp.]
MRPVLVIVVLFVFLTIIITPVLAESDNLPGQAITRSYDYVLDGRPGTLPLALSTDLHDDYLTKKPTWDISDNASYFLSYLNDPAQKQYIKKLADEIRDETGNPDDQARIATSLVQHITYEKGTKYRYPYEVLYQGNGVCGEKSLLLSALLRELGFKSSVLYFVPENHMAAGIACKAPYDFKESGYCIIEATHPYIISDETAFWTNSRTAEWSMPEVIGTSEGRFLDSSEKDYNDARELISLKLEIYAAREAGRSISSEDYQRWYQIKDKYNLQ